MFSLELFSFFKSEAHHKQDAALSKWAATSKIFSKSRPLHFLTDLAGFEPAIYSLGGYRPIQTRLQAQYLCSVNINLHNKSF